jgi:hypothetical protein
VDDVAIAVPAIGSLILFTMDDTKRRGARGEKSRAALIMQRILGAAGVVLFWSSFFV